MNDFGVIRHDLANAMFIVGANFDFFKEDRKEERLVTIEDQIKKIYYILDLWKEIESFGDLSSWEDLENIFLRAKIESRCSEKVIITSSEHVKVKSNKFFDFIFSNLIDNTIRHCGREDFSIKISSCMDDNELVIIYEDNGRGIPRKDKENIFSRGFGSNTGLGMYFVKSILSSMGAVIVENGTFKQGARFEIRIPEDKINLSS